MADAEEMDCVLIDVYGVNDAIIAYSEPVAIRAFQSVMRKCFKAPAEFIDSRFDSLLDIWRESEQRFVEPGIKNLEGAHRR